VPDVQDPVTPLDDDAPSPYRWVVRGVYAMLIGANLWIAFDWWRDTDQGRSVIERMRTFAAECEGCAQRKALLHRATERMHRQARQIVEGGVETQPNGPNGDVSRETFRQDDTAP
jgi:hypothetical protein